MTAKSSDEVGGQHQVGALFSPHRKLFSRFCKLVEFLLSLWLISWMTETLSSPNFAFYKTPELTQS